MNTFLVCLKLLLCIQMVSLTDADTTLIFDGNIIDSQRDKIIRISCLTLAMPFECSMEFLHNNSTIESIRYSNGGCFDKFGECKPEICSCSENCQSFHWNFTSAAVKTNDSFGCKMRIYNSTSNSFYKIYTLAYYNETGFTSTTSIIYSVDKGTMAVQTTPSRYEEKNTVWIDPLIGSTVSVILSIIVFVISFCKCYIARKNIRKKEGESRNSSPMALNPL